MKTIFEELKNSTITIENHITENIINLLKPKIETYVTVLNKIAQNKKILPNLDLLLKSLEEEKICYIVGKTLLKNVQSNFSGRSGQGSQS